MIVDVTPRSTEARVVELLAVAQIHRPAEQRVERGRVIGREYAESDRLELWGYEVGGEVVAIAGIERQGPRPPVLRDLAVVPEQRRRGIGRVLTKFSREHYAGASISSDTTHEAVDVYLACGLDVRVKGSMPGRRTAYQSS